MQTMIFTMPELDLPEFPSRQSVELFKKITDTLKHKAKKTGEGSNAFKQKLKELKSCAYNSDTVVGLINNGRDIRALIYLWLTDYNFISKVKVSLSLLKRFSEIKVRQSSLAIYNLTQVFFKYFEECGALKALASFLIREYENRSGKNLMSELGKIQKHKYLLFNANAPHNLVKKSITESIDLDKLMEDVGVPITRKGHFQDQCKRLYYLESLRSLSLGEDSPVFAELIKKNVAQSRYENGPAIGHEVIRILTAKAVQGKMPIPENWLKVILSIAGDPRVPETAQNYRVWWSQLEKKYIDPVLQVLSRFDLGLFLAALDEYRKRSRNDDLIRMFPSRKKFLEGLFELNLVGKTRLFIGRNAKRFLENNYEKKELPNFADLEDANKSIIYMQIGHMHMIEGSHSSYLWIYDKFPDTSTPLNYSKESYRVRELGLDIAEAYQYQYDDYSNLPYRIQHIPSGLSWQRKAIGAFGQHGIRINPEKVLSEEDYLIYKRYHGLY